MREPARVRYSYSEMIKLLAIVFLAGAVVAGVSVYQLLVQVGQAIPQ